MQLQHKNNKILITGKSGSGKSTYFIEYLKKVKAKKVFVYDHQGEFGFRTKIPLQFTDSQLASAIADEKMRFVVFDPSENFKGDITVGFDYFCELVFNWCEQEDGVKVLACDELQKILGTDTLSYEFSTVLETGRKAGLDLIAICQQPNLLHNRIRNQISEVVSFPMQDERAIKIMRDEWGMDEEKIRGLKNLHYYLRQIDMGQDIFGDIRRFIPK
jgi:ABC-type dipeptide/oligopeptide/nickel transport system ATPase component